MPIALLVALLAVHATVNAVWLATDPDPALNHHSSEQTALLHYLVLKGYPPVATHGHKAAYEVEWPQEPGRGPGSVEPLIQPLRRGTDPAWIPLTLFHLVSVLSACVFGLSYASLALAGTVFFGIAVISVFLLVHSARGAWTGLLAAVIVASYPFMFGSPRQYLIYQSTAAMVALSVALLVRSNGLRRPWMSGFAALSISLGMRAGESGTDATLLLMSLAGPLCVASVLALRPCLAPPAERDLRGLRGLLVFMAVLLPTMGGRWYLTEYLFNTLSWNLQNGGSSAAAMANSLPRDTFGFYTVHLREVALVQIHAIPLVIAALGGLGWLASRWKRPLSWTLLTWVLVPSVVLSAITQKNTWYLSSILPALAAASALGIGALPRRLRIGVMVGICGVCLFQFAWMTASADTFAESWRTRHRQHMNPYSFQYVPTRWDGPTTRSARAVEVIAAELDELDPEQTGQLTVGLVVPDDVVGSCRIELMLKTVRPQMLTCTLLAPELLVRRLDDLDLILYVGDEALAPRSDVELIATLERAIRMHLQHAVFPGVQPERDDVVVHDLLEQLENWRVSVEEATHRVEFVGPVGMFLPDPCRPAGATPPMRD